MPVADAKGLGIMRVGDDDRIVAFDEKPEHPAEMAGRPGFALASMGIYAFRREFLHEQLRRDAADPNSTRDFGRDIIPHLVHHGKAIAHRFEHSCVRSRAEGNVYWRDVGTLDAYFEANIDLTDVVPELDVYDREWPIWTYSAITPPAKFVHDVEGRRGLGVSSLVSGGCIVSGSVAAALVAVQQRARPFVRRDRPCDRAAVRQRRPSRAAVASRSSTAACAFRKVSSWARTPGHDAARFRRTERGVCLITQPMIDRLR